jgi:hypothetical protein
LNPNRKQEAFEQKQVPHNKGFLAKRKQFPS